MMYYWIVKYSDSEDQVIISSKETFCQINKHHITVESLSPLLKNDASFVLGRQISTESTWRDLNDTLTTYLHSKGVQGNKKKPTPGVNIGADNPVWS